MGIGAVVGAVSGVANIIGSRKQAKAAKQAAGLSAEQMQMAREQMAKAAKMMGKGEKYVDDMYKALQNANDLIKSGQVDVDTARTIFNKSLADLGMTKGALGQMGQELGFAKDQLGFLDNMWDKATGGYEEAMGFLGEGLDLSQDFAGLLQGISDEYKQFGSNLMQNWEDDFGNLRENVISYYENLDPEKVATQTKARITQQLDKNLQKFDQQAAQSGIYTSGMKLQAEKDMQFEKAKQFAQADLMAEDYVGNLKAAGYGQFGVPEQQAARGIMGQGILNQAQMAQMGLTPQMAQYGLLSQGAQGLGNLFMNQGSQGLQRTGQYQNIAGLYGNLGNLYNNMVRTQMGIGGAMAGLGQYPLAQATAYGNLARGYGDIGNLYGRYASNYLGNAGQYQNMGNTYARSAAGYGNASGNLFGRGMNQIGTSLNGMIGGGGNTAPVINADNGWLY